MPGQKSLQEQRYYAHPQNAFWPIMAHIFGFSKDLDYELKVAALLQQPVVLWDVLRQCHRQGSLDSQIQSLDLQCNDFVGLIQENPALSAVLCNGGTAYRLWKKHVSGTLQKPIAAIAMPSTSPAHASMRFEQKLQIWQNTITEVLKS